MRHPLVERLRSQAFVPDCKTFLDLPDDRQRTIAEACEAHLDEIKAIGPDTPRSVRTRALNRIARRIAIEHRTGFWETIAITVLFTVCRMFVRWLWENHWSGE